MLYASILCIYLLLANFLLLFSVNL